MLANLIYIVALCLLSPLIAYRFIRHARYRRGIRQKLFGLSRAKAHSLRGGRLPGQGDCIWIHAVSVGEVNLLGGLIDRLQQVSPETRIAISTSTDSGFDLACSKFGEDRVFFCPLDFTWAVRRTLKALAPSQLVLAELELWPNLIRTAENLSVPVRVVNARLSARSARRYIKFAGLTKGTFARLAWVGCQDEACSERFTACGVPSNRIQVTGSIKFDDAPSSRETDQVQECVQWSGSDPWHRIWVAGSTGPGEESMVIDIYNHLRADFPELRLILVPRHRERFAVVATTILSSGLAVHRRSTDESMFDEGWQNDTVILIDTIGELRHWWGVGQIATVGGSFGNRGGQNMLEPAGYGNAVSFGPDTRNFKQIAEQLIENNGAVRTTSASELAQFVRRCLTDIPAADSLGRAAQQMIARHRGATERTVHALVPPRKTMETKRAA